MGVDAVRERAVRQVIDGDKAGKNLRVICANLLWEFHHAFMAGQALRRGTSIKVVKSQILVELVALPS